MHSPSFILASGEGELIWLVLALIIWAVSAIGKVLKNATGPNPKPRAAIPPTPPPLQAIAVRPPPQPQRRTFPAQRKMPPMPARKAPKQVIVAPQAKVYVAAKAAPALPAAKIPQSPKPAPVAAAIPVPPVTAHKTTSASAATISKWMTPKTMQKQFILTELLQPPLGRPRSLVIALMEASAAPE